MRIYQSVIVETIKPKRVLALIDTGAKSTYINTDVAKEIGARKIRETTTRLANGQKIEAWYTMFIVKVRGITDAVEGIIADIEDDVIIGVDFLQKKNVVLDFEKDRMGVKKKKMKIIGKRDKINWL